MRRQRRARRRQRSSKSRGRHGAERDYLNVVRLARTWLYSQSTNAGLLFGFPIYAECGPSHCDSSLLGRRSAAQKLLLRVRAAEDISRDTMDSADGIFLMAR
jgi:hypothetical protein